MKIGPKITFFLNISTFQKNYLIDFLLLIVHQQWAKVQKLPIFGVFNLSKENFNCSDPWYLSCTIPWPEFEKELKRSIQ